MIGEVDFSSALTTVHPKAIYIHQGQQYHVERLDFEQRKAYVKRVNVDYYTDAIRYTQVRVLEIAEEEADRGAGGARAWRCAGAIASGGIQEDQIFHERKCRRRASWSCRKTRCTRRLSGSRWNGSCWRDCRSRCPNGRTESLACCTRWNRWLRLLLMCDRRDLGTAVGERPASPGVETEWQEFRRRSSDPAEMKEFFEPNLYLYDAYPGGIGFSEPLFRVHDMLLRRTRELIAGVSLRKRVPIVRGPGRGKGERTKEAALAILERLCA